jgi:uncharacterized membrane protein YfcA
VSWSDAATILAGFVGGLASGALGIGGGQAFIPMMTLGFRFPQSLAQGTSLAAIVPTALAGGLTHLREGNVVLWAALWMGGGGAIGAVLGALLAVEIPGSLLSRLFGAFLIFNAWRLLASARRPTATDPKAG